MRAARQVVNARAVFASFPGDGCCSLVRSRGSLRFLLYIEGLMQRPWFGS
ncbi:hypothetical protein C4K40_4137 [Pseudomonas sp. CMR5c]|nr:hypothetical protein C4K40_4137 [Pseudomonas sp. CMR5c]